MRRLLTALPLLPALWLCLAIMLLPLTALAAEPQYQTISFDIAPVIVVGGTGTVSATATSGQAVTFSSLTPAVCTVSGAIVTGAADGLCTIAANQAGDSNYYAAGQVTQSFAINAPDAPLITTLKATGVLMSEPYRYGSSSALSYPSTAILNGTVTAAAGDSCLVSFEYGTTTAYGSVAPVGPVGGGSTIPVSATAPFSWSDRSPSEDPVRHYRVKAVCGGGTRYGNDIAFVPIDSPPAANIVISATCSDDATMANYDILNYNSFNVTFDYTSGVAYRGNVAVGSNQVQQIFVAKGGITSFSYNTNLFSQVATNDQLCSATPDPSTQIQVYARGTTPGRAAIYSLSRVGYLVTTSVPVSIIAGSDQFDATAPAGSEFGWAPPGRYVRGGSNSIQPQYIATEIAEAQVSYNGTPFNIASPAFFPWAPIYVVSAAPVSSTPTTALFQLQNNDDAPHTVVLRNGAGIEHRYTLPTYGAQQVTVPYDTWGLYLVIPGMVGPKMVGDHLQVGTLSPALVDQTITFGTPPAVAIGAPATASATASSGLAVAFSSLTPTVCTVSGATVTGVIPGPCTIAANQAGNSIYAVAPGVTQDITVIKGNQTISFGAAPTIVVGGTGTVSVTVTSGLAVSFSSQTGTICSVSGSTVTGLAMGLCTIAADQAGDANYNAAPQVTQSFTIAGVGQTISFSAIPDMLTGTSATASATATSGLPVVFSSLTPLTCSVSGATVTGVAMGTCTIAADQPGNSVYAAASQVTQSFTIGKGHHDLVFGPAPAIVVGGTATVSAGDATGATVLFSSLTPTVCTVSGAIVTGVAAGLCTIAANLPEDSNYYTTGQVAQSFAINAPGAPLVTTLKVTFVEMSEPYQANGAMHYPSTAVLNGTVTAAAGDSCLVSFEYGATTAYGSVAPVGWVGGGSTVPVSVVAAFSWADSSPVEDPVRHYRVKVVCGGGTRYGNDIAFVPFDRPPSANIWITATCSDSLTEANYDIQNSNPSFDITVDYTSGVAYRGNVIVGSNQVQQIFVAKGSITSFSYNYNLFSQVATNDQLCSATPDPSTQIQIHALGTTPGRAAIYTLSRSGYLSTSVPVSIIAGSDQFDATAPVGSEFGSLMCRDGLRRVRWGGDGSIRPQYIATEIAEAMVSYNGTPGAIASPALYYPWAPIYVVSAAPVSSTPTTALFQLQNNDDAPHTVVLRSAAGIEHRYTLPAYGAQQVTVPYDTWGFYLVIPGMVGPKMVGDHLLVGTLSPALIDQTITFGTPPAVAIGAPATASATASSGLAVAYSSLTPTVCTVSGATVTGVIPGPCTIAANQAGNSMYAVAPGVTQDITVTKGNQTISFGAAPAVTAGSSATLSVTATSGLAPALSSQTGTICSVSGSTVTGLAMGLCTIAADQAGDANYNAAPQVTQSFTIGRGVQTISFAPVPSIFVGGPGTALSATASSGLGVSFSSQTGTICGVSGATVTGLAMGLCTIAADQAGNANYGAAPQVTRSFFVSNSTTAAALTSGTNPSNLGQSLTFTATVTPPAATGTITFSEGATTYCSGVALSGSAAPCVIPNLPRGSHTITAAYSGDGTYNASIGVAAVTIKAPPIIAALPAGVVSLWHGDGDAIDSVGANNGTLQGSATYVAGHDSQAFSFDGAGYVTIPDSPSLRTGQFSVSAWFNWTGLGTAAIEFLLGKGVGHFEIQTGGTTNNLRFIPAGDPATTVDAPNAIQPGWNHLVATYSGSEANIYLNNTLAASRTGITGGANLTVDTQPLTIGRRGSGDYPYHGAIDELLLLNRVVSADEVSALYASGMAGITVTSAATPGLTSAALYGGVNDNGLDTQATFEYGTTTAYGASLAATPATVTAGSGVTALTGALTGIACATTYHYRVTAVNADATVSSSDRTFTTANCGQSIGAIAFTLPIIAVNGTSTASATATSGLDVAFSSLTPATCSVSGATVTGVSAGSCTVAADQTGNGSYNPAAQVTGSITVTNSATAVALTSGTNPSNRGQSLTFTATVTPSDATGTVTFSEGATVYCAAVPLSSASASCAIATLTKGSHTITAAYSGGNYGVSTGTTGVTVKTPPTLAVVPTGLVSLWHGDGNANDSAGSNTGTLQGPAAYTTGYVGQAFSFNGAGYVSVPNAASLHTGQFSVSTWFNWAGQGTNAIEFLLSKQPAHFEIQTGGTTNNLRFIPAGDPATTVDAPNAIQPGWNHIVVTYSGTEAYIYMNGSLAASRTGITGGADITADLFPLTIGKRGDDSYPYHGAIDEVALFNRVLSGSEAGAIYNAGMAGIITATAAAPGRTSATLNATVNGNGLDTAVSFEYGATTAYGTTVAATPATVTAASGATAVSTTLTGLTCGSTYHFRIDAVNTDGTTNSADQSFSTLPCRGAITAFVADPAFPAAICTGIDGDGIQRSADSGASWSPATTQPANTRIKALVMNPANHAVFFAATYGGGIVTSADRGDTWTTCANTGLGSLNATALAIDPAGKLYAGTEAGIFTSSDCAAWSAANSGLTVNAGTPPVAIVIDPAAPTTIHAGLDGAGTFNSANSGARWTVAVTQPANLRVKALVMKDSANLYAAGYGSGVLKSSNSGATWTACTTQPTNLNLLSLLIDGSGTLYAGTEAGVFVSGDNCGSWTALNAGLP